MKIPGVGEGIEDWSQHRIIRKKAKIQAVVLIIASSGLILFRGQIPSSVKFIVLSILGLVLLFLLSRPSRAVNEDQLCSKERE